MKTLRSAPFALSVVIATVATAALGISWARHAANVAMVVAALGCGGVLALCMFRIRPRWLGIPAGIVSVLVWLLVLLFFGADAMLSGNSPMTADLGNGQYCRETVYGFVTSDSGEELDIYQRYLLIDYRIYHQTHSDIYPNDPVHIPASVGDNVTRCQAAVNRQRSVATR